VAADEHLSIRPLPLVIGELESALSRHGGNKHLKKHLAFHALVQRILL